MKRMLAASILALGLVWAAAPQAAEKGKKGAAVLVPAAELKWGDVPGFPGLQIAVVEGDPGKGASHFFLKFTAGFSAPVHHHNANHSGTVVSGTLVLTVDGAEQKLPPGSFFAFPNKNKHATRCEPGADCVLSIATRGKWDVIPEAAPKK